MVFPWYYLTQLSLKSLVGLIPSNYIEMKPHNWYYGRITRADAEKLLANKHEGNLILISRTGQINTYQNISHLIDVLNHFK